ncbi:MAG: hypothetical protein WC150_03635 [Bacteroidia bacterium]
MTRFYNVLSIQCKKTLLLLVVFLCAVSVNAQKNQSVPSKATQVNELKGAELFSTFKGRGAVQAHLIIYYSCLSVAPDKEYISVFESMSNRLVQVLELTKDTSFVQKNNVSAPCFNEQQTCITQVRYSAGLELSLPYMDYDLTWGYCFFDRGLINLSNMNRQGFVLMNHLVNPSSAEINTMPSFQRLSGQYLCNNSSISFETALNNTDSDEVSFHLIAPFFYADGVKYNYTAPEKGIDVAKAFSNAVYAGSFLTNQAPFESVQYAKGYSAEKIFQTGNFSINNTTGKVEIKAGSFGKYLISISVKEHRNKKAISDHSIVFITEIR